MKKSQLKQIIREEIKKLNEAAKEVAESSMNRRIEIKHLNWIDHTRIIKWLSANINKEKYDLKKTGNQPYYDYVLDVSKASPEEVEYVTYYLSSQRYIEV